SSRKLTRSFLRHFVGVTVDSRETPMFFLQGGPEHVDASERLLLGLSVSGEPEAAHEAGGESPGKGRADAAIYFPGVQLVALETKVGNGELVHAQMARHAR